jgi:hypothetical protein
MKKIITVALFTIMTVAASTTASFAKDFRDNRNSNNRYQYENNNRNNNVHGFTDRDHYTDRNRFYEQRRFNERDRSFEVRFRFPVVHNYYNNGCRR